MKHWNYRIFKQPGAEGGEDFYTMREVYYTDDTPESYTAEPAYPSGTTIHELRASVERMLADIKKKAPVLTARDFKDS